MAPRRSKSEERDRKREYGKKMSPEKCATDNEKAKKRMNALREQKRGQGIDEKERKQNYRKSMAPEKLAIENEKAKIRMKLLRAKKAHEQGRKKHVARMTDEWEENKKRMRKIRANQSENEKQKESEEAKERMRVFRAKQTAQEKEKEREEARIRMMTKRDEQTTFEKRR